MADRWDELENVYPSLAAMYPTKKTPSIQPMGWFERNLLGGKRNIATTDLSGNIRYNRDAAMRDQSDPSALLAHELKHVQQNESRGLLRNLYERFKQGRLPWESRPDEIEAMAAENPVRGYRRTGDIQLPASVRAIK